MRARISRSVEVEVPAARVWDYVTDWPAQQEWIPFTRVERVDRADRLGGRLRAWTGIGPVGFWDPMTITRWVRGGDGGGVCEVLHTGAVVRGTGEFAVVQTSPDRSRFAWSEVLELPTGRLGRVGWLLVRPVLARLVDRSLQRLRGHLEGGRA